MPNYNTNSNNNFNPEFSAGLFIISTLFLLMFGIMWVRYFAVSPRMVVIGQFKNPGPITKGMSVYYQGVNVGRASKITFSKDYKYTLVYFDIYNEELILPSNTTVKIQSEGITGQKYFDMVFPENPSPLPMRNQQIVQGENPFSLGDLQNFMTKQIKSGKLDSLLDKSEKMIALNSEMLQSLTDSNRAMARVLNKNEKNISSTIAEIHSTSKDVHAVVNNANEILGNSENQSNIQSTLKNSSGAAKKINDFIGDIQLQKNIKESAENINVTTEKVRKTFDKANKILDKTGKVVDQTGKVVDQADGLSVIVAKLAETNKNVNSAAKRVDCVGRGLSDMAGKRFLLFRLMFGKPGKTFNRCKE